MEDVLDASSEDRPLHIDMNVKGYKAMLQR
jgi:hypothetical protein